MKIKRDRYLKQLMLRRHNGDVKVITGIRRCGKSYLLFQLFKNALLDEGVKEDHFIEMQLDLIENIEYRDPIKLYNYVKSKIVDKDMHYVFLDEIQMLDSKFADLMNSLKNIENLDIYVTGSNSKFLSTDIVTEFRGRSDEVRLFPLSFNEFIQAYGDKTTAWNDYYTYGGLPQILKRENDELKSTYLKGLLDLIYLSDIKERHNLKYEDEVDMLVDIIASNISSLTNPRKLSNTFKSVSNRNLTDKTITTYLDHFVDAFLIEKALRYDIKGKKYINTPVKYYFEDVGLRNARLNFRQMEENHIMENIIYLELRSRGYQVDVGVVEIFETNETGKRERKTLETDFIANKGNRKYYIQSAFEMNSDEKREQEKKSLVNIHDSFKKIIVVKDNIKKSINEDGIITMSIFDFLLDEESLEKA